MLVLPVKYYNLNNLGNLFFPNRQVRHHIMLVRLSEYQMPLMVGGSKRCRTVAYSEIRYSVTLYLCCSALAQGKINMVMSDGSILTLKE